MSKIVKEIAGLCYQLDKLYAGEKDKKRKREIGESFDKMSDILEKAIRSQVDENDIIYKQSIRKLRKYSREIKKESEQLEKHGTFFEVLKRLGEQLENLMAGDR